MMNDILRIGLAAIVSATVIVACSAHDLDGGSRESIFVRSALAPPASQDGACVFTEKSGPMLFQGTADFGLSDDYKMSLLVQATDGAAPTTVTSAHVAVRQGDTTLLREYDVVTTGFVDTSGPSVVTVIAIDPVTRDLIVPQLVNRTDAALLTVEVELSGREPGTGRQVQTSPFRLPVRACNGCLVDFSSGNDAAQFPQPNCKKASPNVRKPCFLGQDEPVPCQFCVGARACDPNMP